MDNLIVEGGVPLIGTIKVSGAKNAALPIIFSAILFDETTTFHNVPRLRDMKTTSMLLETLGFEVDFTQNTMTISPKDVHFEAPYEQVKTMRASVLCLGPLLAKLGKAHVAMPGGCAIGARPVDLHLSALEKMGATFVLENGYIKGTCDKLHGASIYFDFPTVGGTENILMAATLAEGETILENAAREPEIVDLANYLIACGAKIQGAGTSRITIQGVRSLKAVPYSIMPDRIEAGTYLIAAGMTNGEIIVENCPHQAMEALYDKLEHAGISLVIDGNKTIAKRAGEHLQAVNITTQPHPGFPTDMQAQFMAMLCLAQGSAVVEETIFENRFMHVPELVRMGADIRLTGNSAHVRGISSFTGAPVMSSDLRAAAAMVLAGLCANSSTTVSRIYHLDRGYESMEIKLQELGAKIKRVAE